MSLLHNIRTVALFEAKTLRRSWFFRLFFIGALIIFTFMNLGLFSPIGDEDWELISIPSTLPLINLYLLNIGQAIVVIFLAADFLKRDKKVDTNEVLYTRSMSNFEYVLGKTWGILKLFLGLDIIILMIGLLMNIISKSMSVDLRSYLSYLLIICVPTIIFSLGLAFTLMSVIRNQAVTFLILLGIAALDIFWLYDRSGSIFDYMAFGLPLFRSGVIGFDNIKEILNQRLLYFFFGSSLVLLTVLLFRRLPQSKFQTTFAAVMMFIFLAATIVCTVNIYSFYKKNSDNKKLAIKSNRQFENRNFVSLTNASIDLQHNGTSISASAKLIFMNNGNDIIDKYIFSLNPYLKVTAVTSASKALRYNRTNQVIEIDPVKDLLPGQADSIIITYDGTIDESFCYPNYSDNIRKTPYRIAMLNINKRQAFLTDNYVLLTPESQWYPVPALNYYPSNPARIKIDFTEYNLRVKTSNKLTAVSQGNMRIENGNFVFRSEYPLTGLTLAIGDYRSDTLKVDSVSYITHYFRGNDYYKKDLAELKDTLGFLVSGIMRELETTFSTKYPFKTLGLLEVPVQFYSYPKMSTQTRAELQPSLILLPEKLILQNAGFRKRFSRQKKRMARNNQVITDKELQVRLFNDFVRNTFISGENFRYVNGVVLNEPTRYRLGPSFYFFKNNFYSSEYPVINAVFESHLQKVNTPRPDNIFFSDEGGLSENDRPNLILKSISFKDLLSRNPGNDTVRLVLSLKGDFLFNLFRAKAGIGEFNTWFSRYIDNHKFKCVDLKQFDSDFREKFGFEFYPLLNEWFNGKRQPGFVFTNLQTSEIVVGDRSRYQVTFTASNPEPAAGLFNLSVRTGGQGGTEIAGEQMTMIQMEPGAGGTFTIAMQGRGMEASDNLRIVYLEPGEAKKIGIVVDGEPRELLVNTLFSKNLPGEITLPVDNITRSRDKTKVFEGEELLSSVPSGTDLNEIIVDNEDDGFKNVTQAVINPLKKMLGIKKQVGEVYGQIDLFNPPDFWQPVLRSSYYGKYVRSSVYTSAGTGNKSVFWKGIITRPGYYDIYTYIGKTGDRLRVRTTSAVNPGVLPSTDQEGKSPYQDMHFIIHHDEGVEEVTVDYENAENGWNPLGRFYLSPDTATVELTNKSSGRVVIGDAIKWVRAE